MAESCGEGLGGGVLSIGLGMKYYSVLGNGERIGLSFVWKFGMWKIEELVHSRAHRGPVSVVGPRRPDSARCQNHRSRSTATCGTRRGRGHGTGNGGLWSARLD